jgi:hypothetical protein
MLPFFAQLLQALAMAHVGPNPFARFADEPWINVADLANAPNDVRIIVWVAMFARSCTRWESTR